MDKIHFGGDGETAWEPPAVPHTQRLRVARTAMACEFEVHLNAGQYRHATAAAMAALDVVDDLEAQLSVYRDDSELSEINRAAAAGPLEVEPQLFELLLQCRQLYELTSGAFDITAGPLTRTWGFYRRQGRIPDEQEIAAALTRVGMQHVTLDPDARTIRMAADAELNLGGIGKGYALDRAVEKLLAAGVNDFVMHGGRSSLFAHGVAGGSPSDGGWLVNVLHPLVRGKTLAQVRVRDRGLSTSGSGAQFFRSGGQRYGHILDPRSGHPAAGMLSVTVTAPTAAQADALSTAMYVLGVDAAREICETLPSVAALLVFPGKGGTRVHVDTVGFAADELLLASDYQR